MSDYNKKKKRISNWNVDGVIKYHRSFSELINTLIKNGFKIDEIVENTYSEDVVKDKFRSLYTAFTFGAPPHAGMAPGIDRIVMLLTDEENLREVQVFPPNVSGMDLLMGSPNTLTDKQLKELGITITEEK